MTLIIMTLLKMKLPIMTLLIMTLLIMTLLIMTLLIMYLLIMTLLIMLNTDGITYKETLLITDFKSINVTLICNASFINFISKVIMRKIFVSSKCHFIRPHRSKLVCLPLSVTFRL